MATPSGGLGAWFDSVRVALKAATSDPAKELQAIKGEKNRARQIKLCEEFLENHAGMSKECDLVKEFLDSAKQESAVAEDVQAIKAEKNLEKQIERCNEFLKTHAAFKKECELVEEFLAGAKKEWGVTEAKKAYLAQARNEKDDKYNPDNKFGLKHLTSHSKAAVKGDLTDKTGHGLDEANVAAIKTYSAQDYKYLNPAVANQKEKPNKPSDWMDTYKEKPNPILPEDEKKAKQGEIDANWPARKKELYEEGALHAGVMMDGLKKMEAKGAKIYRGFRISPTNFKRIYQKGAKLDPIEAFQSTSTDLDAALEFINATKETLADQTVAVLLEGQVFDGRDIKALSLAGNEKEILTLPGTVYEIESVTDMPPAWQHARGIPIATEYKYVKAVQAFK